MVKTKRPPSQGWKTFLVNHADGIASMDLFVVPTISFRLLYGFLILLHARRELLWLGVTAHPTAEWIAQQITEAFGWRNAPRYVVRDRDRVYGARFIQRVRAMGIRDRPIAPRSPWQNGYAERLIGSIRRDCLDHVVVFGEPHLRNLLRSYQRYYNEGRTHLSLCKDAPIPRAVHPRGPRRVTLVQMLRPFRLRKSNGHRNYEERRTDPLLRTFLQALRQIRAGDADHFRYGLHREPSFGGDGGSRSCFFGPVACSSASLRISASRVFLPSSR